MAVSAPGEQRAHSGRRAGGEADTRQGSVTARTALAAAGGQGRAGRGYDAADWLWISNLDHQVYPPDVLGYATSPENT